MCLPSGDQAGQQSIAGCFVRRTTPVPSAFMTWMSKLPARALLKAIKRMQDGGEAPWLQRDAADNPFADFICTSGYIEEDEDGPSFCRRILARKAAAE